MLDTQPLAVSPNLWQTTLTENTTSTQRTTTHQVVTLEQTEKEMHIGMEQHPLKPTKVGPQDEQA